MKNKIYYGFQLTALLLSLFSHACFSAAPWNCEALSNSNENKTIAVNTTTYWGNELPVGSTIYRASLTVRGTGMICYSDGNPDNYSVPAFLTVTNAPSGPSFSFNGMSYGSGQIYPTNVSGVGIAITDSTTGTPFSSTTPYLYKTINAQSDVAWTTPYTFTISLIKTGPISSGTQVNASSFPTVTLMMPAQPGYNGLPLTLSNVNFTGSINFVTSTCTTPDVNVNMGTYSAAQDFQGIGSTSPWVDSSIVLQNCPTFSGYYNDNAYQTVSSTSSVATGNVGASNMMTLSITPITPILNPANGIISVDNFGSTAQAATGVGIQLGYTPMNYTANPTSPTTIWRPGVTWNITPPNNGVRNFKIPLAARYFQAGNTVTAGPANAKVTFNIDYK